MKKNHARLAGDKREERRIPMKLNVAIVYHQHEDAATRPTFHGVSSDISLSGVSVVVRDNIFSEKDIKVLIAIPPEHVGAKKKVIEATAKMVYTVLCSKHDAFRIGMNFKEFKGQGKQVLKGAMERRAIKYDLA